PGRALPRRSRRPGRERLRYGARHRRSRSRDAGGGAPSRVRARREPARPHRRAGGHRTRRGRRSHEPDRSHRARPGRARRRGPGGAARPPGTEARPVNLETIALHTVKVALMEDLWGGDVTTQATVGPDVIAEASILAKANGVLAGLDVARLV